MLLCDPCCCLPCAYSNFPCDTGLLMFDGSCLCSCSCPCSCSFLPMKATSSSIHVTGIRAWVVRQADAATATARPRSEPSEQTRTTRDPVCAGSAATEACPLSCAEGISPFKRVSSLAGRGELAPRRPFIFASTRERCRERAKRWCPSRRRRSRCRRAAPWRIHEARGILAGRHRKVRVR